MDPILALALLSLGIFLGVCATAVFYITIVRPKLLDDDVARPAHRVDSGGEQLTLAMQELSERLFAELNAQDEQLNHIAGKLDSHTGMLTNASAILQDLQSSAPIAALAGRFNNMGEQVNTLLDRLLAQDTRIQEIHAQLAPTPTGETLYALMGQQGTILMNLSSRLQNLDAKLGSLDRQADPAQLDGLKGALEAYRAVVDRLSGQISQQERTINELNTALRQPATLEKIAGQLEELVPDIDEISRRKTRVIRTPDRLTDIKGIGPVYAGLMQGVGISSFKQLAAFTPDELTKLLSLPERDSVKAQNWIEQAKLMVEKQEKLEANR